MDNNIEGPKKLMTNNERLELAAKLDKELDEFIENLPKKKYEDGWPADRWEEEMEKHPFFMKNMPSPGDELHPLYEGLQKLKYDPEENEPEELAIAYKDDGNFNYKYKKYRMAIVAYTEGIKIKCGNPEIEASLYNNRAAAHYYLSNYRSCLRDCELALKLKPDYHKTLIRATNCCYHLKLYKETIEYCDKILDIMGDNDEMLALRTKSINEAKIAERNARRKERTEKNKAREEQLIVRAIIQRGITIGGNNNDNNINLKKLEPKHPELINHTVHLDESNNLIWPVVFLYPEYSILDYIQEFNENNTFQEQLNIVFDQLPEWDREKKYKPDDLTIYFDTKNYQLIKVDPSKTLGEILKLELYIVNRGTPNFIILVKESETEKKYLAFYPFF